MIRAGLALALLPALLRSQTVTVIAPQQQESAFILRVMAQPRIERCAMSRSAEASSVASTLAVRPSTTSVLVIGCSATVASHVNGDVVVIGGDLFLHPGVDISGRAVAIGGTVTTTTLGHVSGQTRSFRDETYDVRGDSNAVTLTWRSLRPPPSKTAVVELAGLQGLMIPAYDRVDGLSMPVGVMVSKGGISIQPSLTYRSRLGTVDPRVDLTIGTDSGFRFEAFGGRVTRTNDAWIYSDLVNSAYVLFAGIDTRNYFRSNDVEGRFGYRAVDKGRGFEPYVGGRFERTSPITAVGNVWAFYGKHDDERMARPNPLVETGDIGSVLAGLRLFDTSGVVTSRIRGELEQSVSTVPGTANFTQFTLDARVGFPTFANQRLLLRGHGVATTGDAVPVSRYAYLGGNGTLPVLDILEEGGTELLFLETRYLFEFKKIALPLVGSPVLTIRHLLGSAGVGALPDLEQEIGFGVGLASLRLDVTRDVSSGRGTKVNLGVSFGHD